LLKHTLIGRGLLIGVLSLLLMSCEETSRKNAYVKFPGGQNTETAKVVEPATGFPTTFPPGSSDKIIPGSSATSAPKAIDRRRTIIRQGTTGQAPTASLGAPVVIGETGDITLHFRNAPLEEFVRVVLGETLGLDYVLTPNLPGTINLEIGRPISRAMVLPIVREALRTTGVALRQNGDLYIIEPDLRGFGVSSPGGIVHVRRLLFTKNINIEQALQPFITPDIRVAQGPASDIVILSGSASAISILNGLIDVLDVDPLAGRSFALFPLKEATSEQVSGELKEILGAADKKGNGARIIDLRRMNAVLVISDKPSVIDDARFWIAELDHGRTTESQIFIYTAQNRRASDLVELLEGILGAGGSTVRADGGEQVAPALTPVGQDNEGLVAEGDTPGGPADISNNQGKSVSVFADEGTNSVVVVTSELKYKSIEAALRRLDIEPLQVLLEATIIEVTLNDELRYGVRWFFETGDVSFALSDLATGAISPAFPGFNFVFDNKSGARAVVSALDAVTDVEVVSSPSLMVLNNETARLQVGDEVPIAISSAVDVTDPNAPIVNKIVFRDTGVILEITPRVNASGVVLLDILQEVSLVTATTTSGIDSPTIQQRKFESSVLLRDRETLALGGLIRSRSSDGKTGVPILSSIPLLGELFKSTDKTLVRGELLVMIRPIVIRNHNEALEATNELRTKLIGLDPLSQTLRAGPSP